MTLTNGSNDYSNLAVVGQGYVGLELAVAAASAGFKVWGVDKSPERVALIMNGRSPVENISNQELAQAIECSRYKATCDFSIIKDCQIVVICVPTPIDKSGSPDLGNLVTASREIAKYLQPGSLIINESTSYPGTLSSIIKKEILNLRSDLESKIDYAVAPERVSPGSNVRLEKVARVVAGLDSISSQRAFNFYNSFCESVHEVKSAEIAEMSKLLENSFRQINIAFINEFNIICRKLGIDTREVILAASTKPYGFMPFYPSAGIGGHCIPVDPMYLQYVAQLVSHPSILIEGAYRLNLDHAKQALDLVFKRLPDNLRKCLLLGVSYKDGLSDTRESPSWNFATNLVSRGLEVDWYDPLVEVFIGKPKSRLNGTWDFALILSAQKDLPIEELAIRGIPIFDFTGKYRADSRIIQI